jgi:hypothetical protein
MVANGPRPAQKHHDAGLLFRPIRELFPSEHIGAGADEALGVVVGVGVDGGPDELEEMTCVVVEPGAVVEVGVEVDTPELGFAGVLEAMRELDASDVTKEEPPLSMTLKEARISLRIDATKAPDVT